MATNTISSPAFSESLSEESESCSIACVVALETNSRHANVAEGTMLDLVVRTFDKEPAGADVLDQHIAKDKSIAVAGTVVNENSAVIFTVCR